MKTERLFKTDVYLKECTAKITAVKEENNLCLISLDRTVFFPVGGGQSSDTGSIDGVSVSRVFESDDDIWHQLSCSNCTLTVGDTVTAKIDWERRFDNMQRHCGEHILSGAFYKLYGGVNRGFHMGEDYMTIDISLEENTRFDKISREMAEAAELAANEAIWNNLPVITRHYDSKADAAGVPLRKTLAFDEDITIVSVGDSSDPYDCVACCGTHPSAAGQVGMIKIYKVETNKGMSRVYFEAGKRAFTGYQKRLTVMAALENKLSAGFDDLLDKFDAQQEKNRAVRDQLYHLRKWVIGVEIDRIRSDINSSAESNYIEKYDILSIDDILDIGRGLSGSLPGIMFLVHEPSNTVLLFSDCRDCGALVKDNAHIYNGKGGGNKNSARAIFSKSEYVDTFIDLIEKHLR